MALTREKIERLEVGWIAESDTPWKHPSKSRKWRKRQMNKYIRLKNKHIEPDDVGGKRGTKPEKGYEY